MSRLREIGHYHAAVRHLEQILGCQESFWIAFEGQYHVTMTYARLEFGQGMGRNKGYEELGPKGEVAFQQLKQWVVDNYPWPEKKVSPSQ